MKNENVNQRKEKSTHTHIMHVTPMGPKKLREN